MTERFYRSVSITCQNYIHAQLCDQMRFSSSSIACRRVMSTSMMRFTTETKEKLRRSLLNNKDLKSLRLRKASYAI